jgi:hypothetical protein
MIKANDNKWRVSVDGQIDMPFATHEAALDFAALMQGEGFDAFLYFSPKEDSHDKQ